MINSFSQYLVEEERAVYFTFGRMNPPTIGHGKLLDKLASMSGRNPYKVFLSQTQDVAKNPLSYTDKVKHVRKMFPKHARQVMINRDVKTAIEAAVELYNQGFRKIVMVVGADRIREFDVLLNKYNGKEARHGFYNFKEIKVVSAGERDPDAEGVEGMSASKMRGFASSNDFTSFAQGLPSGVSTRDAKKLFNDVRKGMGLKEETEFKNHVQLDPVSQLREDFVAGKILNLGDKVCLKGTDIVAEVAIRGSNYVIVEASNGQQYRKWITDVEIIEQGTKKSMYSDKPDWGTPESTKKAKKMTPGQNVSEKKDTHVTQDGKVAQKGLWYNIHQRRKKGLPPKKPGDEGYPKTLKIEQQDMSAVRDKINREKEQHAADTRREKEQLKQKHDRVLDAARRAAALRANRGTTK